MSNLIQAAELKTLVGQANTRLIDARFSLAGANAGHQSYLEGHIPGAIFLDLDKDLSSKPAQHGGRHPLPDMQTFANKLAEKGISNSSRIIIYDDNSGVFAGRVWWMLRYAGHDKVQVLDGGLNAWIDAGYDLEDTVPDYQKGSFHLNLRPDMLVNADYIQANLENPDVLLIDARGAERYRGETEPMDKKAGHIPGAMNMPYVENLQDGKFKPAQELKERFADLNNTEEIIIYCGSGVSANHNLIALEEAGIKGAKLYVGSWSDWSSYEDNPVATGEEA